MVAADEGESKSLAVDVSGDVKERVLGEEEDEIVLSYCERFAAWRAEWALFCHDEERSEWCGLGCGRWRQVCAFLWGLYALETAFFSAFLALQVEYGINVLYTFLAVFLAFSVVVGILIYLFAAPEQSPIADAVVAVEMREIDIHRGGREAKRRVERMESVDLGVPPKGKGGVAETRYSSVVGGPVPTAVDESSTPMAGGVAQPAARPEARNGRLSSVPEGRDRESTLVDTGPHGDGPGTVSV